MERRKYVLADGTTPASVTEILKVVGYGTENLIGWANARGLKGVRSKDELTRSGLIGTCVHDHIEAELCGLTIDPLNYESDILDLAQKPIELFQQWATGKQIKVLAHEIGMVSERFRCGGTLDMVARIDGGPVTLLDFKTSNAIRESNIAQVAAYIDMANEVFGKSIDRALILRFGKDGTSEALEVSGERLERGRLLFSLARQLHALHRDLILDTRSADHLVCRPLPISTPINVMGSSLIDFVSIRP